MPNKPENLSRWTRPWHLHRLPGWLVWSRTFRTVTGSLDARCVFVEAVTDNA